MTVKEYQQRLKEKLASVYNEDDISTEWRTGLERGVVYSPRIDVAIGPFALEDRHISEYDNMMDINRIKKFIKNLYTFHCENLKIDRDEYFYENLKDFNSNARCFMGIEVENKVSSKHLLGGIINVSSMSRIGILIPYDQKKYNLSKRMIKYFSFLKTAGKNTFDTKNVLIIKSEQLLSAINK